MNRPQTAYSQRRYSNAATNDPSLVQTGKQPAGTTGTAQYRITTSANDRSMGDVEIQVASYNSGALTSKNTQAQRYARFTPTTGTLYPAGTRLIITAKPNPGYRFISWSGVSGESHTSSSIIVTVDRNMTFCAMFQAIPQQMRNVHVRWDTSMGRVTSPGSNMQNGELTVRSGDLVTLEATPDQGYHFVHWNGAPLSGRTDNRVQFNVNNNYTIKAVFAKDNPNGGDNPPGNGEPNDPNKEIPGGGGGGIDVPPTRVPEIDPTPVSETLTEKAMAFVKQWWWALLIVGYIAYKEMKGGKK